MKLILESEFYEHEILQQEEEINKLKNTLKELDQQLTKQYKKISKKNDKTIFLLLDAIEETQTTLNNIIYPAHKKQPIQNQQDKNETHQ
jgi:molybdopterin converting factor small subunit